MLHPLFSELFGKLLARWHSYQEVPPGPERVSELARAWGELEDARAEIAAARELYHPFWEAYHGAPEPLRRASVTDIDAARLRIGGISDAGRA